jgi:hypothetical protein
METFCIFARGAAVFIGGDAVETDSLSPGMGRG